jgi:two-component system OmpR family response regulator
MRILVIEDDAKIAAFLEKGLKEAGFAVDIRGDGQAGLDLALSFSYDAAIVDLMLPKLDGLSLIETMRDRNVNTPVLILSARQSVDDRIQGLQRGGDDYMVKPFSFSELLARVQALIRRDKKNTQPMFLRVGGLEMDLLKHEIYREGEKIELPAKEYSLLEYMMRHPGIVLSKTAILERVYDYAFDPQTNVVDVLVCRLRNKIDKDFEDKMIHTVRGMGYVLKAR